MANNNSLTKLTLPEWIKEVSPSPARYFSGLIKMLAFAKMQEYQRRQEIFIANYHQDFPAFEKSVTTAKKEDFKRWDDYIVWKGLYEAHQKWARRYKSL